MEEERFPVVIESAKPEDAETLARLRYAYVLERDGSADENIVSPENIQSLADLAVNPSEEDWYLVAKNVGSTVGMCQMTWRPEAERFSFRRLYVPPEFRNGRIAQKLFLAAKTRAQHSPLSPKGIDLYVDDPKDPTVPPEMNALVDMYKKWGFFPTGRNENEKWTKMSLDF